MVRTRGLGHALGHVTGRGVGRGDHDDSDDAPQPHDEPVVPAPDVEADRTLRQTFLRTQARRLLRMSMRDFRVVRATLPIRVDPEHPELKLSSHGRKVHSLGRPVPAIEGLVAGTRLSPLIACSVDTDDRGLLSPLVERWHRETSSFHLPVGELTITLDDVSSLLHLPVVGDLHAFQPLHVDDAVQMLVDLLMVSAESVRAEIAQCRGPYVRLQWVCDIYERRCQAGHWTAAARAYLLHLLGCTLFANKSATNVHVVYLEALRDLNMTGRYAWGVAALHFPSVADSTVDQEYDEDSPRACRWIATKKIMKSIRTPAYRERLDRLRIPDVCWIPYGEHRSVRDFHVISCYSVSYDDIHDRWMHYSDHIVPTGEVCAVLGQCASDYMDWFFRISHPFMTPGHASDPLPDVVPQAPQTDIPHVPEPGASSTSVDEPRHAVEVCDDIVERLEHHLSLGVVTPGSSTHKVIEECLRMARSGTQDHLVYVRSRRRRRTDQA
ncbi:Protein MAIN-LIKE 1 [Glycine soja]